MPINEDEMDEIFEDFIRKGLKNISLKLYETSSVSAIIEVQNQFLKTMKEEFKDVKKRNYNASMKNNYDYLMKSHKTLSIPNIESVSDIQPSFISSYHDEYSKFCSEYDKSAVGPAKTEAFCKFIEIDFSTAHQSLLQNIDLAYKEHINHIQIQVSELHASEQKWISIINNLKNQIDSYEKQKEKFLEEKYARC